MNGSEDDQNLFTGATASAQRHRAHRPSPALALLVIAAAVLGAIPFATERIHPFSGDAHLIYGTNTDGLELYWLIAIPASYLVVHLIARAQGARVGVWVNRAPLTIAGILALGVLVTVFVLGPVLGIVLPGDLLIRGFLPLLTIAAGLGVWAYAERSIALATVAVAELAMTLVVDLYDPENVAARMGWLVPDRQVPDLSLALVALVLVIPGVLYLVPMFRSRWVRR